MAPTPTLSPDPHTISDANWQIELLYDGDCPLCLREVNFLRRRDGDRGRIRFVDIADPNYHPAAHAGIDFETAMGRIHGTLPDGTIIRNVEVFRRVYEIIGLGWVYAATRWPVIGPVVDWIYGLWADRRLQLTGRPDLKTIVAQRQQYQECSDRCRVDEPASLKSSD